MNTPSIGFDEASASFYHSIIANVLLNAHAVRMGYFDTLLCETNDPLVARRWKESVPNIIKIIQEHKANGLPDAQ